MKKFLLTMAFVVAAGSAFAATPSDSNPIGGANSDGLPGFKPSKNVKSAYASDTVGAGATEPDVYSMGTKHSQGNVNYGTTSAVTSIYMQNVDTATTVTGPDTPASTTDSTTVSGWSQM